MPRRYGADGTRLWNGKTPEEFTEADAYRFMAETEAVLQRKELMDDPAQPAPASGKEEFYLSKKDDVLLTPEQIAAEERRWLFDAPIAELAEVKGVSIDEAVKMRTDAVLQEAVVPITVSVRPIEPQGKLIGFASVNFGGVVIDDFKVVDGKNGIFLGAPSKPDPASRTGYRATVRIPDRATQERINAAGVEAYHAAVEQLVARAQAVRPALSQRSSGNSSTPLFCKPMRQSWNRWRSAALWGVRPSATSSKPEKRLPNRQRQNGLRRKSPAAAQSVDLGPCWPEAERLTIKSQAPKQNFREEF